MFFQANEKSPILPRKLDMLQVERQYFTIAAPEVFLVTLICKPNPNEISKPPCFFVNVLFCLFAKYQAGGV